ncbi:MAG: alpha/beta hydrolase family protein [Planctomycetaceae bacterium]
MRSLWILTLLAAELATPCAGQDSSDESGSLRRYEAVVDSTPIPKFSWQRYFTKDKFDRRITFYISKLRQPVSEKLPLIVCVQGSGSQSVFLKHKDMIASGGPEAVIARDFRQQARVLVVEKPGVEFLVQPSRPGSSEEGTKEFNREFSLNRWVEAVNAATQAAMKLDEIDPARTLILGHSEGGQVACEVAAVNPKITHVAVMAGGGPTQVFDFLQLAREGKMYDPAQTPQQRVDAFMADWKKVRNAPNAADKFILGHSHLRWSSFTKSSPVAAIQKSKARVFIAQGTDDTNSLPASAEVLYAELLAHGRDVTYERVEGGNHGFMTKDDKTGKGWSKTNGKAVRWFLGDFKQEGNK